MGDTTGAEGGRGAPHRTMEGKQRHRPDTASWSRRSPLIDEAAAGATASPGCHYQLHGHLRVLAAMVGAGRSLGVCISCENSSFKTSVARPPATHIATSFDPYAGWAAARGCLRCWRLLTQHQDSLLSCLSAPPPSGSAPQVSGAAPLHATGLAPSTTVTGFLKRHSVCLYWEGDVITWSRVPLAASRRHLRRASRGRGRVPGVSPEPWLGG